MLQHDAFDRVGMAHMLFKNGAEKIDSAIESVHLLILLDLSLRRLSTRFVHFMAFSFFEGCASLSVCFVLVHLDVFGPAHGIHFWGVFNEICLVYCWCVVRVKS